MTARRQPSKFTGDEISTREAADRLGVTLDALYSRIRSGTLRHTRRGGRWFVDSGDLDRKPCGRPRKTTTNQDNTP